jgi:hypothetical protein
MFPVDFPPNFCVKGPTTRKDGLLMADDLKACLDEQAANANERPITADDLKAGLLPKKWSRCYERL